VTFQEIEGVCCESRIVKDLVVTFGRLEDSVDP